MDNAKIIDRANELREAIYAEARSRGMAVTVPADGVWEKPRIAGVGVEVFGSRGPNFMQRLHVAVRIGRTTAHREHTYREDRGKAIDPAKIVDAVAARAAISRQRAEADRARRAAEEAKERLIDAAQAAVAGIVLPPGMTVVATGVGVYEVRIGRVVGVEAVARVAAALRGDGA